MLTNRVRSHMRFHVRSLVRLLTALFAALLLASWLVQPSFAAAGVGTAVASSRADSIIDPGAIETDDTTDINATDPNANDANDNNGSVRSPGTETFDEDGNKIRTTQPNSRTRILDDAVAALKNNPPVYVDPRAQLKLTKEQQDELAIHIQVTGDPIYVAILPSQAGRPTVVTESIANEVGKPGVYVTIVGVVYSAYATEFEAKHLLTQAFIQERHDGQAAVLNKFVDLTSEQLRGEIEKPQPFPPFLIVIVACMVLALPVILLLSGRRNRGPDKPPTQQSS